MIQDPCVNTRLNNPSLVTYPWLVSAVRYYVLIMQPIVPFMYEMYQNTIEKLLSIYSVTCYVPSKCVATYTCS